MPRPDPPEFRQRAVELARTREKPVAEIAADLEISDSCLRNWMAQADRDEGRRNDGLTTAERDELVKLR
jgi:transposase-like protein